MTRKGGETQKRLLSKKSEEEGPTHSGASRAEAKKGEERDKPRSVTETAAHASDSHRTAEEIQGQGTAELGGEVIAIALILLLSAPYAPDSGHARSLTF